MLGRIPRRILSDTLTLCVPTGFDRYQKPTETTYTVTNVHLQASNDTRKTADNTEVVLRGVLFVDRYYSQPQLDYEALQEAAQQAGGVMRATVAGRRGASMGPFTVLTVDGLPDDEGNLHHWELGLV